MKRALLLAAFCGLELCALADESGLQTAPPSASCVDQNGVNRLFTRIHNLERQLDESLEARLKERAEFNRQLEKSTSEAPARSDGGASELRSRIDAANREIEQLRTSNEACSTALEDARKVKPTTAESPAGDSSLTKAQLSALKGGSEPPSPASTPLEGPPKDEASKAKAEKAIAPGSVVAVHVDDLEEMNVQVAVNGDGTIDLPLIGRVPAAGRSETSIAKDIEHGLSKYLVKPKAQVTLR